jgi:hypothetical protein
LFKLALALEKPAEPLPNTTRAWLLGLRLSLIALALMVVGIVTVLVFMDEYWLPVAGGLTVMVGGLLGVVGGLKQHRAIKDARARGGPAC